MVDLTAKPFNLEAEVKDQRVKPAGEWNTFELTVKGRSVALWVNGAVANEWKGCGVPRGYIGLEVDGGRVEFRNLKTGKCHRFGRVEPGLLRKSFGLDE